MEVFLLGFLDSVLNRLRRTPPPHPVLPVVDRNIVILIVYPADLDREPIGVPIPLRKDTYFITWPLRAPNDRLLPAIYDARAWLNGVLGVNLSWYALERLESRTPIAQWREQGISALKRELRDRGKPLTREYVYLALVRGMGGYAGGLSYTQSDAGFAMLGDICIEALCSYSTPNAASALLDDSWPDNARSRNGQTAALLHELLHALGLSHPDSWPVVQRPNWSDTIMGYWWNMPRFARTKGLTGREIERVLKWLD